MWLYRQVYRSQEGFEQMKMNRKIFLAGAALFLLGQVTAGFAAPQAAGGVVQVAQGEGCFLLVQVHQQSLSGHGLARRFAQRAQQSHLGMGQIAAAGDPHDITLELGRELLGHGDILPAGPGPTDGVST